MFAKLLDKSNQEMYSSFVASQTDGSFLQSWSWGDFQQSLGKQVVRCAVFESEQSNKIIAVAQFILIRIPYLSGIYAYCPYGPLLQTKNENTSPQILQAMIHTLQVHNPDLWFIRLEPKSLIPRLGNGTKRIQPGKTLITNLIRPEDEILQSMHQKTRYNIKVAEKHGIVVNCLASDLNQAINLLTDTSKRQNFSSYDSSYYFKLLEHLSKPMNGDCKAWLYQAFADKQCVASAIQVDWYETRTYLFGGSDYSYRHLMAPYALHWQAMSDAKKSGINYYDWWGLETSGGATPGFAKFKLNWGGAVIEYPEPQDIVLHPYKYRLYKFARVLNKR